MTSSEQQRPTAPSISAVLIHLTLVFSITPALAGESDGKPADLHEAALHACWLDALREEWWRPSIDPLVTERRESIWIPRFNNFQSSPESSLLVDYAAKLGESGVQRYTDAECKVVVPAFGVSYSATHINFSTIKISSGPLLVQCGDKLCVPPILEQVRRACEVPVESRRYLTWCGGRDPLLTPP